MDSDQAAGFGEQLVVGFCRERRADDTIGFRTEYPLQAFALEHWCYGLARLDLCGGVYVRFFLCD